MKSDAVSQSNINAKKLATFELPLPEIDEQEEIVHRVNASLGWLSRVREEVGRALELNERAESAILDKGFSGQLLPQNPNDEPASALLRSRSTCGRATRTWLARR